jgi:hypothetical protein
MYSIDPSPYAMNNNALYIYIYIYIYTHTHGEAILHLGEFYVEAAPSSSTWVGLTASPDHRLCLPVKHIVTPVQHITCDLPVIRIGAPSSSRPPLS